MVGQNAKGEGFEPSRTQSVSSYGAAVSASCGSMTDAMSFRVAAGLTS